MSKVIRVETSNGGVFELDPVDVAWSRVNHYGVKLNSHEKMEMFHKTVISEFLLLEWVDISGWYTFNSVKEVRAPKINREEFHVVNRKISEGVTK